MTTLNYKGYVASAEIDVEDNLIFGEVLGLRDMVTFHGGTVEDAVRAFHESVDLYLLTCQEQGIEPDRPASVLVTIRVAPQVHDTLLDLAAKRGKTFDQIVEHVLAKQAALYRMTLAARARSAGEAAKKKVRKEKAG